MNQEFAEQTYLYDFNGMDCFMNFSEQEFYYCLHQLSYQFDEFQNKNGKESHKCPDTIDEIKQKFHRSDGEGLLKNIKDKINLDLEIKKTDSLRERFDKFRLLKLIYAAEKLGVYRGNLENENIYFMNKCSILNIISNPKNIYMYNNYDDSFLEEFEVIYDNVRNVVKNAEKIESTIDDLYNSFTNSERQPLQDSGKIYNRLHLTQNEIITKTTRKQTNAFGLFFTCTAAVQVL